MNARIVTIVLVVAVVFSGIALAPRLIAMRLPGNHAGFEPAQPIVFSHRLHAGELNIQCEYCHSGAQRSRHAGTPAASTCMNCHKFISAKRADVRAEEELAKKEHRKPRQVTSTEINKLYVALKLQQPIRWNRIHQVPDFVYFDHRPHVAAGLACQKCHGPVETMERVRQIEPMNMGWCVNCHRGRDGTIVQGHPVKANADCSACHF
ncbi:MAG TPA: cytochrome c3 family protein [Thermoanaerobaculia bacterium]|nr:cytochrome c3 family protein [Thermoanaerobaculia bacterium]